MKRCSSAGVSNYEFDEALTDFKLGALYNLLVPVKAHGFSSSFTDARAYQLLDAATERIFVSAIELDCAIPVAQRVKRFPRGHAAHGSVHPWRRMTRATEGSKLGTLRRTISVRQ